jgi:isopentenyl-diphosphate Delta-isomerase
MEYVTLVNKKDKNIGVEEKIHAHKNGGKLHRAFSILTFNDEGQLLLQLRSVKKYHFGGLWSNTCCGHPRPNERTKQAGERRLEEEFGFTTNLTDIGDFIYKADYENGLTEHELDHILIGKYDGDINPNPDEIDDYKYISIDELKIDVSENPTRYSPWFKEIVNNHLDKVIKNESCN